MPSAEESIVPADLFELLELFEAAQRALCEDLRVRRSEESGTRTIAGVEVPPVAPPGPSPAHTTGSVFDPVKAGGGHATKRHYNYFVQLADEIARSGSATGPVGHDTDIGERAN